MSKNFDLLLALQEKSGTTKVITNDPEGDMMVCPKFHGNPLNTCHEISLKNESFSLLVVLEKKSEGHRSYYTSSPRHDVICGKLIRVIHVVVA